VNYLCTYKPLIRTKQGRQAVARFALPPYVDGSCRREPDFELMFPSITALCRAGKFAPRLQEDDNVDYITVKGKYTPINHGHWRLVAILRVIKRFESHKDAAEWYTVQSVSLPSNCIVHGNLPLSLEKTNGGKSSLSKWNAGYRLRAAKDGAFLACEPQFLELHTPPVLTSEKMRAVFNRIPATQNPPSISEQELAKLRDLAFSSLQSAR
jgi:hypothetical protein